MAQPLEAPWSEEVVEALNAFQDSGVMHPYTCPECGHMLVATHNGWICLHDEYLQTWAHPFTADQEWVARQKEWVEQHRRHA